MLSIHRKFKQHINTQNGIKPYHTYNPDREQLIYPRETQRKNRTMNGYAQPFILNNCRITTMFFALWDIEQFT